MKVKITAEFKTLRPGDKKNSIVQVGEVVEGALATTAIANGFGKQVPDETPVGKRVAAAAPAPAKAEKKGGKGKGSEDGGSGADGQGSGGQGSGEGQ